MLNQALDYSGVNKRLKHFLTKASNAEIKQLSRSTLQPLDHSQGNIYSVLKRLIHLADKEIFLLFSFKKGNIFSMQNLYLPKCARITPRLNS